MNKIKTKDKFKLKEVPDLFFLNDKEEVVYCVDTIKSFKAKYLGYGKWSIKFTSPIFHKSISSFWTNYNQHYNIYCRTFKRSFETGEDIDFCFRFNNAVLKTVLINTEIEGKPCDFPIIFMSDNMEFINNEDCPKLALNQGMKEIFYPIEEKVKN